MIKILVVDDVKKNIQILGTVLGSAGYAVSYATSGAKALAMAMAATEQFNLILLDIMMPEMSGFEVCRKLKEHSSTNEIPVLFLSALSEQEDIVHGFQLGAVDYITKPFNRNELLERVKTHVELQLAKQSLKQKNQELQQALDEIKTLRGILPICMHCKKIRNDDGYWQQLEAYLSHHSEAEFSHGVCTDCIKTHYPEMLAQFNKQN